MTSLMFDRFLIVQVSSEETGLPNCNATKESA